MDSPAYRFGATLIGSERTRFRLWAPGASAVSLLIENSEPTVMSPSDGGWFVTEVYCGAGIHYRYRVHPDIIVPDPASRLQASDPQDESIVVNHDGYVWHQLDWVGRPWHEAIIYELHVGLLGGFAGVTKRLPELAALGITAIELMPIGDFPGPRNWGYDGTDLCAGCELWNAGRTESSRRYGTWIGNDGFPGRRIQSLRSRRKLSRTLCRHLLRPGTSDALGQRNQLPFR